MQGIALFGQKDKIQHLNPLYHQITIFDGLHNFCLKMALTLEMPA